MLKASCMNLLFSNKWLILFLSIILLTSCSRRNYSSQRQGNDETTTLKDPRDSDHSIQPPEYIALSDDQAKANRDGELYFIDSNGYRYWKFCDGKYYLDSKYDRLNNVPTSNSKLSKRKNKRSRKNDNDAEI